MSVLLYQCTFDEIFKLEIDFVIYWLRRRDWLEYQTKYRSWLKYRYTKQTHLPNRKSFSVIEKELKSIYICPFDVWNCDSVSCFLFNVPISKRFYTPHSVKVIQIVVIAIWKHKESTTKLRLNQMNTEYFRLQSNKVLFAISGFLWRWSQNHCAIIFEYIRNMPKNKLWNETNRDAKSCKCNRIQEKKTALCD